MFITKKKLNQLIENAKLDVLEKEQEKASQREAFSDIHRYLYELDKRLSDIEASINNKNRVTPKKN